MIIELSKKYVNEFYNGNVLQAVKEKDGIIWDSDYIKKAFCNGNGTQKDFNRYANANKTNFYFINI